MRPARLGVSVASRSGLSAADFGRAAAAAEAAGLDAFLVAERVADAFALCQAAIAATESISVGTAVANARLRHPALTAMTAATLDELSGGRMLLGLGVANPGLNEDVLGLSPVAPVGFTRDYVDVVHGVLAGRPHSGGAACHPVRGLRPDRAPARAGVPVLLAALLPRMLRLAGEVADGVLLNLTTPRTLPGALTEVRAGAEAAGRDPADLTVACVLPCSLGDDPEVSERTGRELVVGYALHPAAARLFAASGYADELAAIAAVLRTGDRAAALALVTPEMVDDFLLRGDEQQVADRLLACLDAGVDLPVLFPTPGDGDWPGALARTLDSAARIRPRITREVPA